MCLTTGAKHAKPSANHALGGTKVHTSVPKIEMNETKHERTYKSAGLPACLIGRCCSCFRSCFVLVSVLGLYLFLCSLAARFCFVLSLLVEGSLEVKLPTIWTVEKQR
jgi:hypothetical protein